MHRLPPQKPLKVWGSPGDLYLVDVSKDSRDAWCFGLPSDGREELLYDAKGLALEWPCKQRICRSGLLAWFPPIPQQDHRYLHTT